MLAVQVSGKPELLPIWTDFMDDYCDFLVGTTLFAAVLRPKRQVFFPREIGAANTQLSPGRSF